MSVTLKTFFPQFRAATAAQFPWMKEGLDEKYLSDLMLSPDVVEIPKAVFFKTQEVVRTFHALTRDERYIKHIDSHLPPTAKFPVRQNSVLMSYDFHLNEDGLGLIEINTNAAGFPMMIALNSYHKTFASWPALTGAGVPATAENVTEDWFRSFLEDHRLWSNGRAEGLKKITIIDDRAQQQRTYFEFLIYRDYFKSRGLNSEVKDSDALIADDLLADALVYNRDTDFYFQSTRMNILREAYLADRVCVTPNPRMYGQLADKERSMDWSTFLKENTAISGVIPTMTILTEQNRKELWDKRKNLFFKPIRSHGGKGAFRGSSVSHKVFNAMPELQTVAQTFIEPGLHKSKLVEGELKFDLRIFAYQDRIQGVVARLYQGQVTNFRTLGGGFAAVKFI